MSLTPILLIFVGVTGAIGFGYAEGPIAAYFRALAAFFLFMFSWRLIRREPQPTRRSPSHAGPARPVSTPEPKRKTMTLRTWVLSGLVVALLAGGGYFFVSGGRVTVAAPGQPLPEPPASTLPVSHGASTRPVATHPVVSVSAAIPDLPITLTRRSSSVGRGLVGQLRSTGDTYLRLAVAYKNVTTGKTTTGNIEVGPNGTVELGWLEGYPLATGDTLTLSHPNYKPRSWEF